jgi:hypothetical protein
MITAEMVKKMEPAMRAFVQRRINEVQAAEAMNVLLEGGDFFLVNSLLARICRTMALYPDRTWTAGELADVLQASFNSVYAAIRREHQLPDSRVRRVYGLGGPQRWALKEKK